MDIELSSINFYEIFITIVLVIVLGFFSSCLFFWFKGSSDETSKDMLNNHSAGTKKKLKKKLNSTKSNKLINGNGDVVLEKLNKSKHIEIKTNPEILEETNKEAKVNLYLYPAKPILRKNDEIIHVSEENCQENNWSKIPKDDIEIRRSRQSSLVSETRSATKEELEEPVCKLSRCQKKRIKAKLKEAELKNDAAGTEILGNDSVVCDLANEEPTNLMEDTVSTTNKSNLTRNRKKRLNKKLKNSSNSTESSMGNEKQSFSPVEFEDKVSEPESPDLSKLDNITTVHPLVHQFNVFETESKCNKYEIENKELKHEVNNLKEKLNEFSALTANMVNVKKENAILQKKQIDLERTCTAIQKELAASIQKATSAENRLMRLNNERNQQNSYYEGDLNKKNSKIVILEGEVHSKGQENENLKMNLDQMRHLVTDKEQTIQNLNNDLSVLKEQFYKKRHEYQEMEVNFNNIKLKFKEIEIQNQKLKEENQILKMQMDIKEKEKEKDFEKLKIQSKNKDREHDSLIFSLQYQIDEFVSEKLMLNHEIEELRGENEKLGNLYRELKDKSNNINPSVPIVSPEFELIESEKLTQLTLKLNEGNRKLQEKCDHYNLLLNQQSEKEQSLVEKNAALESNYSKLNLELESHLNEIINLKKCIEELQSELLKNSENNLDEIKTELDEKCEKLRKAEEILHKLESSVDDEACRWKVLLDQKSLDNEMLENQLKEKNLTISTQSKKINELTTLLQSNNQCSPEALLNGSLSVE